MKTIVASCLMAFALFGCKEKEPSQEQSSSPAKTSIVNPDPATAGSISGTMTFKGNPTQLGTIDMTADPACPQAPQASDNFVVKDAKLANVFVYVKAGLPSGRFAVPSDPVVLDQKGCRYLPHMLGIMAGQPLKILNSDAADHNVHAMANSNPSWNESQMSKDPAIVKSFARPESMIAVQCNQHPWMKAYINVMANPYYAVSGLDGHFEIRNLPPGEYTIVAVHEKFGEQTARVRVVAKESAKADFTFIPVP